jgi:hypothetical protein
MRVGLHTLVHTEATKRSPKSSFIASAWCRPEARLIAASSSQAVTVKPRRPVKPVTMEMKPGSARKSSTFCRECARIRSRSAASAAVIQVSAITPGGPRFPEAARMA